MTLNWFHLSRWGLAGLFALIALTGSAIEPKTSPPVVPTGEFDDAAPSVAPQRDRSPQERDKLAATALFSSGRMLEQNKDNIGALRKYQRAVRLDPGATTILREIMPLAFSLGRQTEAIRYASKLVEQDPSDATLSLQIGRYLAAEGKTDRALKVFADALSLHEKTVSPAIAAKLRMEVGRLEFLKKRYGPAADAFAQVKAALDDPKTNQLDEAARKELLGEGGFAYELFGECFVEADRHADAIAAFESLDKLSPNKGIHAYHVARVFTKQNKWDEALAKLQIYFDAKDPLRSIAPYELLADILKASRREDQLLDRMEKRYENNADNVALAVYLARTYASSNAFDKAEAVWRRIMNKQPIAEAYEGLAQVYRQTKQLDSLWKHVSLVVAKTNSLEGLGAERKKLSADPELVRSIIALARTKLQENPAAVDGDQRQAVAMLALDAKLYEPAAEFFNSALSYKPRKNPAEMLLIWGLELFSAERFDEAVKVLQRGIDEKAFPDDNPVFYYYLAGALEFGGKTEAAISVAKETIQRKPKSPRFASRLPWIYYHAKRHEEAFQLYLSFTKEFGDDFQNEETREAIREARLSLSNLCVIRHDLLQAEEWLEQVLDEFPDDVGALNDLGYLWADANKNLHRALPMVEAAVAAEPENLAYRDSLGWVYHRLGREEEALQELKRAIPEKDPDATVFEHLGEVCSKLKKHAEAADYWKKSVDILEKTPGDKSVEPNKINELKSKIAAEASLAK